MSFEIVPEKIAITVTGSSGSATKKRSAHLCAIGIIAPAGAVYDLEIVDGDGFGLFAKTGISGNATLAVDAQLYAEQTISLTNATNGSYSLKLWFKR